MLRFEQKKQRYSVEMITSANPNLAYDPVAGQKHLIRAFQIETPPMLQVQEDPSWQPPKNLPKA